MRRPTNSYSTPNVHAADSLSEHWTHVPPFPTADSDAEALASGAEPLADSAAEVNKKARKLRKRGQETADAAVDLASTAASEASDLATAAAEEAAEAAAAVQEEAVSAASRLAESVASDVADIAGAVQAAAEDVQQTAADAARDASTSTDTTVSTKQPAAQPPAGSLGAPSAPAGELPSAQQPVTALLPPPDATTGNGASSSAAGGAAGGDKAAEAARLKESLVAMLASLDRGAAASEDQAERVDALVKRLEALGGPVSLSWERPGGRGQRRWGVRGWQGEGAPFLCAHLLAKPAHLLVTLFPALLKRHIWQWMQQQLTWALHQAACSGGGSNGSSGSSGRGGSPCARLGCSCSC